MHCYCIDMFNSPVKAAKKDNKGKQNKCVSKMHIRQMRGGGSYNYVQHPIPFSRANISVADCMPLSNLLKTINTYDGVECRWCIKIAIFDEYLVDH